MSRKRRLRGGAGDRGAGLGGRAGGYGAGADGIGESGTVGGNWRAGRGGRGRRDGGAGSEAGAGLGVSVGAGARSRGGRGVATAAIPTTRTFGDRPTAPWHPLPISEVLILVGAIAVVYALQKSAHGGAPPVGPLLAGIGAVAIGTLEVTIREHRSGYRSHTILLAAVPVVVFHAVAIIGLTAAFKAPEIVNAGLFAIDLAGFAVLFRLLRSGFLTARLRSVGRR